MARPPAKSASAETARKPLANTGQGWRTDSNSPAHGEKYVTGKHFGGITDVKSVAEKVKFGDTGDSSEGHIDREVAVKLAIIEAFVLENPGASVSSLILELFPQLDEPHQMRARDGDSQFLKQASAQPLTDNGQRALPAEEDKGDRQIPAKAPAFWLTDRDPDDTPPDFIRRHYGPWLGKGLRRADLRPLDPSLYAALSQFLLKHEMPSDIDLPTVKEYNDRWVASIASGERKLPDKADAVGRLRSAASFRGERLGKS